MGPLLLAGVIAVLATGWWLVAPSRGIPLVWPGAPGGPLPFRLRFRSPLAALLWVGRRPPCGLALFGVVHVREETVSPALLAHELGHVARMRGRTAWYLARYVAWPPFRAAEEAACWALSDRHRHDPWLARYAAPPEHGRVDDKAPRPG